tara:strand:+ start:164 stop:1159 length:996 start_codon:yes stop_codon:yes gene_type:complete
MLKILYFTSEKKKKYGVFKVVNILKKKQNKKLKVKISDNIFDIFFFNPKIIHIHGCWRPKLIIIFLLAKITFTKIVISPHGMIDPLSFAQKKIKKIFAWFIYQKYIFMFSNLIVVNSDFEKKNLLKKIKFYKNIKIIKHGVNIPEQIINLKKNKRLTFVFFSRIHPSKNLIKLIKIWKKNNFFDDYILDVYGEIDDLKYFEIFKNEIQKSKNINYKGKINSNKLIHKLSKYDVFLHPSNSENFGLVILEAISCGLFPVVNKKLDWKTLDKNNLGCSLNFNHKNLKKLIIKLNKSKQKIRSIKFKKRTRKYLLKNFNWDLIINEYNQNYKSL